MVIETHFDQIGRGVHGLIQPPPILAIRHKLDTPNTTSISSPTISSVLAITALMIEDTSEAITIFVAMKK